MNPIKIEVKDFIDCKPLPGEEAAEIVLQHADGEAVTLIVPWGSLQVLANMLPALATEVYNRRVAARKESREVGATAILQAFQPRALQIAHTPDNGALLLQFILPNDLTVGMHLALNAAENFAHSVLAHIARLRAMGPNTSSPTRN